MVVSRESIRDRFRTGDPIIPDIIKKYGSKLKSEISIDGLTVTLELCSETKEISEKIIDEVYDSMQEIKKDYQEKETVDIISIEKNYS